jgi:hypothetical protein
VNVEDLRDALIDFDRTIEVMVEVDARIISGKRLAFVTEIDALVIPPSGLTVARLHVRDNAALAPQLVRTT